MISVEIILRGKNSKAKRFDAMKNFTEHCVSYKGWYCFLSRDMFSLFCERLHQVYFLTSDSRLLVKC